MAKLLQLVIQGDVTDFTFDVEGEFTPSWEPVYRLNANPPALTEIRETWLLTRAKIVSTDGTAATLWTSFAAFLARIAVRGATHPADVKLKTGAGATLRTLGPASHEQLRFEVLDGLTSDLNPADSFRTVATITLRVSAVSRYADANGIGDFDQRVRATYDAGLRVLEYVTTVTTAEGTSALTKAQGFAKIDIATLGGAYTYETNGPDGIEYEVLDADEGAARVPTAVRAVSRVREWGIATGATVAGGSPSEIDYRVDTETDLTSGKEVTTTFASARGPNALAFVQTKAPTVYDRKTIVDDTATRFASGTWQRTRDTSQTAGGKPGDRPLDELRVTITGGHQVLDWEPCANNVLPVDFVGGFVQWRATVEVTVHGRGKDLGPSGLPFPGVLPPPWVLNANESDETEPERLEPGQASSLYRRRARLVYETAQYPAGVESLARQIREGASVDSYLRGAGGQAGSPNALAGFGAV